MKKILMFTMAGCPYCRKAHGWMDELLAENPAYAQCELEIVDETVDRERADQYDYYYVPTYYVDGKNVHEGAATREIVQSVFGQALAD